MRNIGLSFRTAQTANRLIDALPQVPKWSVIKLTTKYPTREPILFYKRDVGECVEYMLSDPMFADHMHFVPVKHYDANGHRIFCEAISGMQAWNTQVSITRCI
jgi:hypothetical protein